MSEFSVNCTFTKKTLHSKNGSIVLNGYKKDREERLQFVIDEVRKELGIDIEFNEQIKETKQFLSDERKYKIKKRVLFFSPEKYVKECNDVYELAEFVSSLLKYSNFTFVESPNFSFSYNSRFLLNDIFIPLVYYVDYSESFECGYELLEGGYMCGTTVSSSYLIM